VNEQGGGNDEKIERPNEGFDGGLEKKRVLVRTIGNNNPSVVNEVRSKVISKDAHKTFNSEARGGDRKKLPGKRGSSSRESFI